MFLNIDITLGAPYVSMVGFIVLRNLADSASISTLVPTDGRGLFFSLQWKVEELNDPARLTPSMETLRHRCSLFCTPELDSKLF